MTIMTCNIAASSVTLSIHVGTILETVTIIYHFCFMMADLVLCSEIKELPNLIVLQICGHFPLVFLFFFELAASCYQLLFKSLVVGHIHNTSSKHHTVLPMILTC